MKKKIVINADFGRFEVSRAGVLRGREISGDPLWGGACLTGDEYGNGKTMERDFGADNISRYDPVLVQVVEELGPEASTEVSQLEIIEVETGVKFRIDEYDGKEQVMTIDDYDWHVV